MGRPPLNMTPTLVRFPSSVLERIDALVGPQDIASPKEPKHRAKFIRQAVEAELERREREANLSAPPDE